MFSRSESSLAFLALVPLAVSLNYAKDGGVMVQLFEWSHSDVAAECESFLGPKGFRAVQISPPNEHITGSEWWTRYQPVTYALTSRSGDEAGFKDMVQRCKSVGVEIIVDSVINHMAAGSGVGTAGSKYGSRSYPFYSPQDFHHDANNMLSNCEVSDYSDKYNVQYCDLVGLPDLATGSEYVQSQIAGYINNMVDMGIAGIRIDAAKHQDDGEMSGIIAKLPQSSSFYIVQEVISGNNEAVGPSDYYSTGQVTEFNYADFLDANIVNANKMKYLETFGESWGLMPDKYSLAFLDNHDTQRNGRAQLTYKSGDMYTFANVFMLSWPYASHIRLMSSYYFDNNDQGPPSAGVEGGANCADGRNWVCEHRWTPIASMVAWRNTAGSSAVENWQVGSANQIAFSRGGAAFLAMNRDTGASWSIGAGSGVKTGLPQGEYCNVIASPASECSQIVSVGADGTITSSNVQVPQLSAIALQINARSSGKLADEESLAFGAAESA